jgi:hypothetical protein
MPDLARLRSDLAAFAAAIGQPLAPRQAAALRLRKRTTVVAAPRQSGKSRALAVLSLLSQLPRDVGHTEWSGARPRSRCRGGSGQDGQ